MVDINVITELNNAIQLLNNVDEYTETLVDKLSSYDKRTSDLLHYIESNKLNAPQCCRIVKELKVIREERRKVKNDMEISKVYKDNINKLINKDNRNMLMIKLYKQEKQLGTNYKNRIYTEENINNILEGEKKWHTTYYTWYSLD